MMKIEQIQSTSRKKDEIVAGVGDGSGIGDNNRHVPGR